MNTPKIEGWLSRRRFLEKTAKGAAGVALVGALPGAPIADGAGQALRIERSGNDIRFASGDRAVCLISPTAIGSEGAVVTAAEFGPVTGAKIERRFSSGSWEIREDIEEMEAGVFAWHRSWKNASAQILQGDLCMEAESAYASQFYLIPGASYNGNPKHGRTAPQGLASQGSERIFSAYRSTVPAATYSEGEGWSVFLFAAAQRPSMDCACSLVPRESHMVHRLLWPGRDNIRARDVTSPCEAMPIGPGENFDSLAYIVIWPADEPRKAWAKGLDTAWKLNRHDMKALYPPGRLWNLGIQFASESLWYEKQDFTGFSVGLVRKSDTWQQRNEVRFESGWCGQNASLGTAMLQDYLWHKNPESLRRGMKALDFWADNGRLDCGLFYTHFDVKLGVPGYAPYGWGPYNATFLGRPAKPLERYVDTCNLGYGAYFYLLAYELAQKCGSEKPAWRKLGLDTCNFFVEHALDDGTFGKAWSLDGRCLDREATTGSHLIWPLLKAFRMTRDERYLATARRAFRAYVDRDLNQLDCWGSALDADCLDRESGQPLLLAALDLYEITGEKQYLEDAKMAGYYLASWQWHYSVAFPKDGQLAKTDYDIFGGTSISARGPGIDPWGEFLALGWMRLASATGDETWRDRGIQAFRQATLGVSDGNMVLNGLKRPVGSQNESMGLSIEKPCGRGMDGKYNDWLVAWPTALRLITLMHWGNWADFGV